MKENKKTKNANIEALLFDYAEGNLSPKERQSVERLIESNPEYAALLQAYDKNESVECPCNVLFEDKEALFGSICKERKPAVFLTRRKQSWIYSVAAVLLLLVVSTVAINYIATPNKTATQPSENKHTAVSENKTPFQENKTAIQSDETAFRSAETAFRSEQVQEPVCQEETEQEESPDNAVQMQEQIEAVEPEAQPQEPLLAEQSTEQEPKTEQTKIINHIILDERTNNKTSPQSLLFAWLNERLSLEQIVAKAVDAISQKSIESIEKLTNIISKVQNRRQEYEYVEIIQVKKIKS
ncbi:MAG: hypothetical protein PUC16_03870 [Bacteroidales bacterium]|nr:hypothetical protein [Bacteroidales bacterium]MDD5976387.1 hypothetical protein [Bacteroidales bacterium]